MRDRLSQREATESDIPTLVQHRRLMFEEIRADRGETPKAADLDAMESAYTSYIRVHLVDKTYKAWVVESGGKIIASGAVSVLTWPPGLGDTTERAALLHSMYTVPEYRRNGLATQIVLLAIEFCKSQRFKWIRLGTSEAGRPLYKSLGFRPIDGMLLSLSH